MYARAVLLIIAALVVMVAPAGADSEGDAFVTKSAPAAVTAGDTITYTITVGSNGPGPAVDVELKDPVPAGTTALSAEPESQCDEVESDTDVFECDLGTVSEENPETITLVVQTSEFTPSSVTNVATITSGEGSDEPNNEASATTMVVEPSPPPPPPTPEPPPAPPPPTPPPPTPPPPGPPPGPEADLVLTKQDAPDPVGAGGLITYSLTVTNAGPDSAAGVRLVDDLPSSATLVSASSSQGFCSGTDPVSCQLGSIASSASATVTIVVRVAQPGFVFNTAAVFASFPSDPVPANNGTAATTTVVSSSSPPPSPPSPPTPPAPPSPPVTPPPSPPPTTTLAAAPDVIPPRDVAAVRATVSSRSVVVRWRTPSDPDFLRVEMTRSSPGVRERVVYSGSGETFTDRSVRNGVRYVYRLRSFDRAGNASTGVQFVATPKALLLFSPRPNARVSSPPLLRWVAVRGARYYNVQLYRGKTKVLSTWPRANRLQLRGRWTFRGRSQRLVPGVYHWFVWSGRGSRARPSYGPLLGQNSFVVEVRVR